MEAEVDEDKTIVQPRLDRRADADLAVSLIHGAEGQATIVRPQFVNAGDDATVIRPRALSSLAAEEGEATTIAAHAVDANQHAMSALKLTPRSTFEGDLAAAAADLLTLSIQVRHLQPGVEVQALRRAAGEAVRQFQQRAEQKALPPVLVARGSYLLCSLIDETVLNAAWGEASSWSQHSLLLEFHGETYGGDKVFAMIDEALTNARREPEFLELAYLCLALGFEGRHRIEPHGHLKLEQLRREIYLALGERRDRFSRELAPDAVPAFGVARRLQGFRSLWLLILLLSVATVALFLHLQWELSQRSEALSTRLATLIPTEVRKPLSVVEPVDAGARLRELLAPEIERTVLHLEEHADRISIVLHAEALFESGSATVVESLLPILDKIAKALEAVDGQVVVTGHTDSTTMQTARYPSNWHLSLARASAVVQHLSNAASLRGRILPEGRGDAEPVASNTTTAGRARNRRVAIDLFQPSPLEPQRAHTGGED